MALQINNENFQQEVLDFKGVVLVDFWATWCGPCQMLAPTLDELEKELSEGAKIAKIDIDENSDLASEYKIMSIPSLKIFKDGELVEESVAGRSKEDLKSAIEKYL